MRERFIEYSAVIMYACSFRNLFCINVLDLVHPREGCIHNDFACSAYICIPLNWVCDGAADCPDALDERNCPSKFSGRSHIQKRSDGVNTKMG